MTYCVGLLLDEGMVMAADSRTNAGVDYISTYSKLHVLQPAPDRLFVLMVAGSLATTREVLDRIGRDLDQAINPRPSPFQQAPLVTLLNVNYLFEAATYIGQVSQAVQNEHGPALRQAGVSAEASFILGGQIAGQAHGLFLIYPQGNAIAATPETPYLQIGESKYGKPALDRIVHPGLSLADGARICLVSLVGTARSNLSVGPPFEVAICPRDQLAPSHLLKLPAGSPDLAALSRSWDESLSQAFFALPRFSWEPGNPQS
ncbi:20S proteasome subunit A/B [Candidatus Thiodictyon syntrophicum]|jgi:putative proteasome-type protease|uniref:20S proteasome subunit A/B n=1 Tax=Candidatus Thiodictyon syntrophicum TaxID=1166950 RepID=A0A2K8UAW0_9GAMM|nr:20S proteasome subunit A/B [Candidatus Thiodictyon syntrophicum]AUB82695.1 20S proteasome subunit A/B [Candidatus Thiodictyon syntrophicum]